MRLMYLEIRNFRGIREAKLEFPRDRSVVCIIGPGDSCKSTILKAIEWVFYPSWNLLVTDNDFHGGKTESPIIIEATISDIPSKLSREDKFGLLLRDLDKVVQGSEDDEPTDEGTPALTMRLTVDSSLEPKWETVTNRTDPKPISQSDRRLLAFGSVGIEADGDFQWGRGSVLQRLADSKEQLHSEYIKVMRDAVDKADLSTLDKEVAYLEDVGKQYGVSLSGHLGNKLLMKNGSYSTNAGLFDGSVPFSQRGLGSKRLLSIGMNVSSYEEGTLVLLDEVEAGLEPYRIVRLINKLREVFSDRGQMIMTTHSQTAVCECEAEDLLVCRNDDGNVRLIRICKFEKEESGPDIQGIVRGIPEAFLSRKVIACEGKTEVGLLRAYERMVFINEKKASYAYYGTSVVPCGGGEKCMSTASFLKEIGYEVCVLMDSDLPEEDSKKQELELQGIRVFAWDSGSAIEEQVFSDSSIEMAQELIDYAVEEKSLNGVKNAMDRQFCDEDKPYDEAGERIKLKETLTEEQRRKIGTAAKKGADNNGRKGWFKRIDHGERMGDILFDKYDDILIESGFRKTMSALADWVADHDGI